MRAVHIALALLVVLAGTSLAACGPPAPEVTGTLQPDQDLEVDIDTLSDVMRGGQNIARSRDHGFDYDETDYIGENWTVRSVMNIGTYDGRTYYFCLATDEVDGQEVVSVSLVYLEDEEPRGSKSILAAGEYRISASVAVRSDLHTHMYGDEDSPVIAITHPEMAGIPTMSNPHKRRLWLLAGWVNDPDVHELTIKLREIGSITLCAEEHHYFVGVVADRPMTSTAPAVVIEGINAVDAQGNTIP